jgi:hypothetical protein
MGNQCSYEVPLWFNSVFQNIVGATDGLKKFHEDFSRFKAEGLPPPSRTPAEVLLVDGRLSRRPRNGGCNEFLASLAALNDHITEAAGNRAEN